MAKKVLKKIKVQVMGGAANPAPPLGPTLGQAGVNIGEFVSRFNEATQERKGEVVPTELTIYEDRSFDFVLKTPPASSLIMKAIGIKAGSGKNTQTKVGTITQKQLEEIAEQKMEDLSANDAKAGARIIAGTARSMGVEVKG